VLGRREDGTAATVGGGVVTAVRLHSRPPTPLDQSLARLETLVSPYTGIVRRIDVHLVGPDDARLIRIGAKTADGDQVTGAGRGALDGTCGWAEHEPHARAAAIGEAAERYAGSCLPADSLLATAAELGPAAVDPGRFALFAAWQYAQRGFMFEPFTREARVRWVRGFSLPDAADSLLPAQLVYLGWRRTTGEAPIGYATSNGLACGATLEEAVLAGLFELIERDAFMLTWTNRLSMPLLDWSDDADLSAFESRYLAPAGARHHAVDLSPFLDVPVVIAAAEGDGVKEPAFSLGAGSAPTVVEAAKKALAEAYAVRTWGRLLMLTEPDVPDSSDVTTFADHIHFYTRPPRSVAAQFLVASSDRRSVGEVPALAGTTPLERIAELTDRLARRSISAYAVDVTSPDVAAAGVAVAKVVAPELCSLDVRHDCRFLGGERLYRAAFELGLAEAPLAPEDVNPCPHPFP
jgi:ribosomal protein S12 methylthiotransferase accessory factor